MFVTILESVSGKILRLDRHVLECRMRVVDARVQNGDFDAFTGEEGGMSPDRCYAPAALARLVVRAVDVVDILRVER
jgi:hypothetical protein